jgi:uncharacterized protein (DUF433 family)
MSEPLILSDPQVMMGKPVIAGTRITVDLIPEKLGSGKSIEAVLEAQPRLTREAVLAALRFAAQALRPLWLSTRSALDPREPVRG